MSHAPEHGGRILLVRGETEGGEVCYSVELATRESLYRGELRISAADGKVVLGAFDPEPPEWLVSAVPPLARTLWTSHEKDPNAPWPRRLHRWREPR